MCANIDLSVFYPFLKKNSLSFTPALVYVLSRAANNIPEFRYRIRNEEVILHEVVHPSITVLTADELFSFCLIQFDQDFSSFSATAEVEIARSRKSLNLEDDPSRDDFLFMTAIPWISFTNFSHPMHLNPADSIPRFAWGKYYQEGDRMLMPLSVQGHHALMDGIHMGKFYAKVQEYLDQPETFLGIG